MPIKPLYLLADSQLLFLKNPTHILSEKIWTAFDAKDPKAAYIGASNGDQPEFYDLFTAAMSSMQISNCRMIPTKPSSADISFLENADLILLAGGSDELGWAALEENGLKDLISLKRIAGAILMGISAGAVQLGLGSLSTGDQPKQLPMFRFAPFYIGSHDEQNDWWDLRALVNLSQSDARGIGIPAGAGAIYHIDGTLEPIRKPLFELIKQDGEISEHLLMPLTSGS